VSQRLNSFLASSQELSQLAGKAKQLLILQHQYEQVVPPTLRRASRVMQYDQHTLILSANNSAVAAKLRQMTPDLLTNLHNLGCEVTLIQVRVQVDRSAPVPATVKPVLSSSGKQQLHKLADTLADSPLKRALLDLIRLGSRR
jgi:hypothetical protein